MKRVPLVTVVAVAITALAIPALAQQYDGSEADLSYYHSQVSVTPLATKTAAVACPKATHIVGLGADAGGSTGGFQLHAVAPYDGTDANHIPDDGMRVRATNGSNTAAHDVTAYGICSTSKPIYAHHHATVQPKQWFITRAVCPDGYHVIGGGVRVEGDARIVADGPYDSGADDNLVPDDGWRDVVYNTDQHARRVDYYGICTAAINLSYQSTQFSAATTPVAFDCAQHRFSLISGGLSYAGDRTRFRLQQLVPLDEGYDADSIPDDGMSFGWFDNETTPQLVTMTVICERLPA